MQSPLAEYFGKTVEVRTIFDRIVGLVGSVEKDGLRMPSAIVYTHEYTGGFLERHHTLPLFIPFHGIFYITEYDPTTSDLEK